jgi:hypothetical protein
LVLNVTNDATAEVLVTPVLRDALVGLALRSTAPETVTVVAQALFCVVSRKLLPPNRVMFVTSAVRDALMSLAAASTSDEALEWTAAALQNTVLLSERDQGMFSRTPPLFATAVVRDALTAMSHRARTLDAAGSIASVFHNIVHQEQRALDDVFAHSSVRDALVGLALVRGGGAAAASAPLFVERVAQAVTTLATCRYRALYSTTEVRDALVGLAPMAATSTSVERLARAMLSISHENPHSVDVFTAPSMQVALITMASHAASSDATEAVSAVVCSVVSNCCGTATLLDNALRDALIAMVPNATTSGSVRWLANALCLLMNSGQCTMGVNDAASMCNAFVALSSHVSSCSDASQWVIAGASRAKACRWVAAGFCCLAQGDALPYCAKSVVVRDALVDVCQHTATTSGVEWVAAALHIISRVDKTLFQTDSVRNALERLRQLPNVFPDVDASSTAAVWSDLFTTAENSSTAASEEVAAANGAGAKRCREEPHADQ